MIVYINTAIRNLIYFVTFQN